jgi:hypothetical protein
MRLEHKAEAFATGAWLGLTQAALGFSLMAGAGASATMFLLLTGVWIGAGAAGVTLVPRRAAAPLLGAALAAAVAARLALAAAPFQIWAVAADLAAGALCGAYAGAFLRHRAAAWGTVRALLLHENNGFVAGFAAAGGLLLAGARALDVTAVTLGVSLLAWSVRR